jgi:pimeloyl-ACP methyl ester carboxylesterase
MPGIASPGDTRAFRSHEVPVLFVHGQPGLGSDFEPVADRLGEGFTVLSPDRPGYGSNPTPPLSMHENAEALAELIEESDAAPSVVVGHSFGGGIALLLAQQRRDLVAGLVLASSVGYPEELGNLDHLLAAPVLGEVIVASGLGAAGTILPLLRAPARFAPGRIGKWAAVNLPDAKFKKVAVRRGVWRTVVAEQRALLAEIDSVGASLPEISVPTEVVAGTWDIIVGPEVAGRIASTIHGSELVLVSGTGHFLTRDAPVVLADAVRRVARKAGFEVPIDDELPGDDEI